MQKETIGDFFVSFHVERKQLILIIQKTQNVLFSSQVNKTTWKIIVISSNTLLYFLSQGTKIFELYFYIFWNFEKAVKAINIDDAVLSSLW